jgi:hypothetical protein
MLTGYNTDIKHEGVIYHVQTEDGGTDNPFIVSLIYQGGRILASKKTSYAHLLGTDDLLSRIRDLLEEQHRAMIKAIVTGVPESAPEKAPADAAAARPSPQAPAPPTAAQPQAETPQQQQDDTSLPPTENKPPLEIPAEAAAEDPADRAAEKNLDQVILEYLASEIDKD